jgi:hypothetical protein
MPLIAAAMLATVTPNGILHPMVPKAIGEN